MYDTVINLFYLRIDKINHPDRNKVPENCLFCIDGGESVLCFNCNKQSSRFYKTTLCRFEFPESDVQNSVQLKMESMTMDEYGHVMDEPYQCIHCHPVRIQTSQNRTMMNAEIYMVIQLEIFNYDQVSKDFSKTVPNLKIEEKIHNILLETFQLQAIVYHIGCSPFRGHYKSSVKHDNIWYTTNNLNYSIGVELECTTSHIGMISYLLICQKIGNDPLLISNVETDMSQLSNELHNIDDVLGKVGESCELVVYGKYIQIALN